MPKVFVLFYFVIFIFVVVLFFYFFCFPTRQGFFFVYLFMFCCCCLVLQHQINSITKFSVKKASENWVLKTESQAIGFPWYYRYQKVKHFIYLFFSTKSSIKNMYSRSMGFYSLHKPQLNFIILGEKPTLDSSSLKYFIYYELCLYFWLCKNKK